MTTNTDRAAEVLRSTNVIRPHRGMDANASAVFAQALADAGLLTPAPQIIRTVEELEALDPDTVVWPAQHYGPYTVGTIAPDPFNTYWTPPLPAVVVAPADQVRAAREALEEA